MKEKILFLVTQAGTGGAQRYVGDLARAVSHDYDVVVAAGEPLLGTELAQGLTSDGIRTILLPHLRRAIVPGDDIRAVFDVARLIRNERPAILHTNSSKANLIGALAARLVGPRPRVVATIHGWVFREPLGFFRRSLYRIMERIAATLRDRTIVLGASERAAAMSIGIPADRLSVIPLGVTQVTAVAAPRDTSELRIVTIANLYRTKGLDTLIAAMEIISKKLPDARATIIGEGPERQHLEALIASSGLTETVTLRGAIPEAARLLPNFDIFVLPSRKEGLPYTLLEAAGVGLPIVATTVGCIPEVIQDGVSGLLVPPEHPAALASALIRLASDSELRMKVGRAAREASLLFTRERMVADTQKMYNALQSAAS